MQCYTELVAPTAVTHSLSLPFLSPSANNLIVAKTSLLQIFSLKTVIAPSNDLSNGSAKSTRLPERIPTTKLVLIAEYDLSGSITSLARVKILKSRSGGEALLVALQDAKLSLIEWDPERYSISTISIHYYERDDIIGGPWEPELAQCVNYLSVDPSSRCAALKFGARHLAILPFHQAGDDLVMDDYDPDIDGKTPQQDAVTSKGVSADQHQTPYAASFVLSLLALDPSLTHPIHLSFLYEYREPTFGILYSQSAASSSLLHERPDVVSFAVYTLDLEQKASTTLLSVNKLPCDLHAIIPLSRVIGGVLLIGGNEIIHVDQSGKTSGVAVNDLSKTSTAFPLTDQSELNLRLERCVVKQLGSENTDLLVILNTGELAIISFSIDGRSVSGLSLRRVHEGNGGFCMLSGAACASIVGRGRIFIGSESADSAVLSWSRSSGKLQRRRSYIDGNLDDPNEISDLYDGEGGEDDEDDDDLYANEKPQDSMLEEAVTPSSSKPEMDYLFRVHDVLQNLGPMTGVTLRPFTDDSGDPKHSEIMTTSGYGRAGKLTSFLGEIIPKDLQEYDIPGAESVWTICPKHSDSDSIVEETDRYLVARITRPQDKESTQVYIIRENGIEALQDTDFDPDEGRTIEMATLNDGTRIVQVLHNQVRAYDANFGLVQIFPLVDEESDEEPTIIRADFADPYLLLTQENQSLRVLKADESGDIEEVEQGEQFKEHRWICGSLYEDTNDVFRLEFGDENGDESSNVLMFLLSAVGALKIYRLPSLRNPVYVTDGLSFLPPSLDPGFVVRRASAKDSIVDILVSELGDVSQKGPHLVLRSSLDDVIIYQPFQSPINLSKNTELRFVKITNATSPQAAADDHISTLGPSKVKQRLRSLQNLDGHDAIFVPGPSASLIMKTASSLPQVIPLVDSAIPRLVRLRTLANPSGFVYIDALGNTKAAIMPIDRSYTTGLALRTMPIGSTVTGICHHASSRTYAMITSLPAAFSLPVDEQYPSHHAAETTSLPPLTSKDTVELFNPLTESIISSHALDLHETALCMDTASLEISELTHERAEMVAVGTCLIRGEDLPTMGRIYVFAIIPVVPDPDVPGRDYALKLISKEEVRGAVTAVDGIGSQGFLMAAQGQKVLVRGLKEDRSFLPVAFMDVMCYVSVAKELQMGLDAVGQGLCLMGDAVKGIWLTGYMEDPYQLRLFGKSPHHIETIAADFLPDGKQLYIVVADADCNLQILQFDPDNPKSMSGTRLLHHTTFHTPHYPSTLTLLPTGFSFRGPKSSNSTSNDTDEEEPANQRPILITSQSGSIALLTALPEASHRTLTALQSHCFNALPHPLGLNPRGFRAGGEVDSGIGIGRSGGGVIDGNIIRRWEEGGSWKRWAGEERSVVREMVWDAVGGNF